MEDYHSVRCRLANLVEKGDEGAATSLLGYLGLQCGYPTAESRTKAQHLQDGVHVAGIT